jgi:hypothetical protein
MPLPLSRKKETYTHKYKFIKKSHNNEGLNTDRHFIGFVGITADSILTAVLG